VIDEEDSGHIPAVDWDRMLPSPKSSTYVVTEVRWWRDCPDMLGKTERRRAELKQQLAKPMSEYASPRDKRDKAGLKKRLEHYEEFVKILTGSTETERRS